jgi:hypothetical protein
MLEMPPAVGDPTRQAEEFIERLKREQRPRPLNTKREEGKP